MKRFDPKDYQNNHSPYDLVIVYKHNEPCPALRIDAAVTYVGGWEKFFELKRLGGLKILFDEPEEPGFVGKKEQLPLGQQYAHDTIAEVMLREFEMEFDGVAVIDAAIVRSLPILGDQSQIIY